LENEDKMKKIIRQIKHFVLSVEAIKKIKVFHKPKNYLKRYG